MIDKMLLKLRRRSSKTQQQEKIATLFDETLSNEIDRLGFQKCVHFAIKKGNQEMH